MRKQCLHLNVQCAITKTQRLPKTKRSVDFWTNYELELLSARYHYWEIFSWMCIKMNNIINKFLLAGYNFMPEIHLRQLGFTYSACRVFTKSKTLIKNQGNGKLQLYLQQWALKRLLSTWYTVWRSRISAKKKIIWKPI